MPTKQLEGKIAAGHVVVAEESVDCGMLNVDGGEGAPFQQSTINHQQSPVGYCIGHDQYFKRDDVGIIYQLNVVPGKQRGLIGARLIKAMFERAAYGCRLFCCWCAQDIEANYFWESLGFIPLAFRAGSRGKQRVHIFWQRRIREGDTTTPYWFPSQTTGGSIREDRLVLPIPPGTHWSDAKPIILPETENERPALPEPRGALPAPRNAARGRSPVLTAKQSAPAPLGGWTFTKPKPAKNAQRKPAAAERKPRRRVKNDPKLVAAARELRDRWMEQVNADEPLLPQGKYDVSRRLKSSKVKVMLQSPLMIEQKIAA